MHSITTSYRNYTIMIYGHSYRAYYVACATNGSHRLFALYIRYIENVHYKLKYTLVGSYIERVLNLEKKDTDKEEK